MRPNRGKNSTPLIVDLWSRDGPFEGAKNAKPYAGATRPPACSFGPRRVWRRPGGYVCRSAASRNGRRPDPAYSRCWEMPCPASGSSDHIGHHAAAGGPQVRYGRRPPGVHNPGRQSPAGGEPAVYQGWTAPVGTRRGRPNAAKTCECAWPLGSPAASHPAAGSPPVPQPSGNRIRPLNAASVRPGAIRHGPPPGDLCNPLPQGGFPCVRRARGAGPHAAARGKCMRTVTIHARAAGGLDGAGMAPAEPAPALSKNP